MKKFGLVFLVIVVGAITSVTLEFGFHIQRPVAYYLLGMIVGMLLERIDEIKH